MGGRRKIRMHGAGRYLLAGLVGLCLAIFTLTRAGPDFRSGGEVPVGLINNGLHTDLAMPREALIARGGPLAEAVSTLEPGDWVLVGWGDARFYVETSPVHTRLPDGARAFFAPGNPSVVMLYPVMGDPLSRVEPEAGRRLMMGAEAFEAMAARVERSLDLSTGSPRIGAVRTEAGDYGDEARFFASTESFSILHLCNHWTSQVLNAGGLSIRPFRSVVASEVVAAVDRELDSAPARD